MRAQSTVPIRWDAEEYADPCIVTLRFRAQALLDVVPAKVFLLDQASELRGSNPKLAYSVHIVFQSHSSSPILRRCSTPRGSRASR